MRQVKAIMCDVDGTLLTDEHVVSPLTVEAIKKVREKGILFGLATGRDVKSVKALLKEWGLDGLIDSIVGTGGAEISDFVLGVEKESYPLEGELIHEIISHYQDMDVNFAVPYDGILYVPKDDGLIQMLSRDDQIPYQVVDFDKFLTEPRPKVMIVCQPSLMEAVIERSQTFQNGKYKSAALKTASILFEYMDPRVNKTRGLNQIAELHGFSMEELCTIGDADNDYDMTLHAGLGVVMGNGSEKTKSVADYITDDNNHDGIWKFINQHILGEE